MVASIITTLATNTGTTYAQLQLYLLGRAKKSSHVHKVLLPLHWSLASFLNRHSTNWNLEMQTLRADLRSLHVWKDFVFHAPCFGWVNSRKSTNRYLGNDRPGITTDGGGLATSPWRMNSQKSRSFEDVNGYQSTSRLRVVTLVSQTSVICSQQRTNRGTPLLSLLAFAAPQLYIYKDAKPCDPQSVPLRSLQKYRRARC